jgi:hypothetical protein
MSANVSQIHLASNTPWVAGDAALGNDKAQSSQLTMDLGCARIRILTGQAPDQDANFFGTLRPSSAGSGPAPVAAETGTMPADDGFGLDDDENFGPTTPAPAKGGPEDAI